MTRTISRAAARHAMRLAAAPLVGALLACGTPADLAYADVRAFARACGDPGADAASVIKNCSRALQTGQLGAKGVAQAFLNRGAAFATLGEPEQALRDFDQAAGSFEAIPEIWSNRGRALLRLEKPAEALDSYDRAAALGLNDLEVALGRATAMIELGASDQALPILEPLQEQEPRNLRVRYQRARAYAATGVSAQALVETRAVLEAEPAALAARLLEAQLLEPRDPAAARASYAAAIEVAPDDPRAYYRRGRLIERSGDQGGAAADLRRAWDLGYRDEWLNDWLQRAGE